jgi:hypothetical protein
MRRILVAASLVTVVAPSLNAQERHARVMSSSIGTATSTRSTEAGSGRNDDVAFALLPCPEPPAGCSGPFLGPVRVTGLSTGLEGSWIDRRLLLLGSVGPGAYWLTDRPPGTRGFTAGLRVGIGAGYQLAPRLWAVVDLQYHRLFADGGSPRWLIPGSIGLEVR